MDDMKKAAYISAREFLETGKSGFVCIALQDALEEIAGVSVSVTTMYEVFHEFTNLFDGLHWTSSGDKYVKISYSSVWWEKRWKEPRIRIIDMIMSQE